MTKKEVKENFQKFHRCCLNITQYDCDGNDDFGCESSCPYYMSNEEILKTLKAVEDILEKQSYIPDPWDGIKPYAPDSFYAKYYDEEGNNVNILEKNHEERRCN